MANAYLYGSATAGSAGTPIAELSDICRIDQAFTLLSSLGSEIRDLALQAITAVATERLRRPATEVDIAAYLSGEREDFRARATPL